MDSLAVFIHSSAKLCVWPFHGTEVLAGSDFASTGVANAKTCDSHRRVAVAGGAYQ